MGLGQVLLPNSSKIGNIASISCIKINWYFVKYSSFLEEAELENSLYSKKEVKHRVALNSRQPLNDIRNREPLFPVKPNH